MKRFLTVFLLSNMFWATSVSANAFMIFNVSQDLPMGVEDEVIRKNFYVNLGSKQGVRKGTVLDVFRIVSVLNPYDNRRRINHKVKMGQVKVIHAGDESAITTFYKLEKDTPVFELDQFIVGDHVAVNTD
jgi:hypothetical protein